ncbi:NAD(P)/FAD-dependent oxidoreductase [Desulfolithobacter sp.]
MKTPQVVVVGGGPAGLMAAAQAALSGAEVMLLEKMATPGRKLCITGKGRCNITNIAELPDFLEHFGPSGRFLHQAFARFFTPELLSLFEDLGLPVVVERGGRVFPQSGQARDVLRVLQGWVERVGAKLMTGAPVARLRVYKQQIIGVVRDREDIPCDAVVLATGGASCPGTGSTGDGYRLARVAGHRMVEPRPALVPLETEMDTSSLAGLALRNIQVRLLINGKKKRQLFGEMAFTPSGVSGPVILTLSGAAVDGLRAGRQVSLVVDLKPALDESRLDARLLRDFSTRAREPLVSVLRGLLPRELVGVCLAQTGLAPEKSAAQVQAKERRQLKNWLKNFRLEISGHRPLREAIVTAGGVDTREVDPRTMQSKQVAGLYFAGEILDIQGDTGGYNLQAAFSTGWLAGRSAAGNTE